MQSWRIAGNEMQVAGGAIHRLGYPGVNFLREFGRQVGGVGHGEVSLFRGIRGDLLLRG